MHRKFLGVVASIVAALSLTLLASCGSDDSDAETAPPPAESVTLHVLAAASLTETFDALADKFEADHDGVTIEPVYDSSGTLATQVIEGAPADVLATADLDSIGKVDDAGDAGKISTFAENHAVLVTPAANPAGVTAFADISKTKFVICVDTAPCGKVGAKLLASNGVTTAPVSLEQNVKAVLTKVTSGEADAGIVYVTDALASGTQVKTFDIPGAADAPTDYGITVVKQSEHPDVAQEFLDFVLSDAGQKVLSDAGFDPAP